MKLAVLLYGQPRFWDLSWESIIQETTFEDSTTDYYFHFWDKIAYHSHDDEYQLTKEDKEKIVSIYKPKNYSFTDYTPLEEECENIYKIVEKNKKKLNFFYTSCKKLEQLQLSKSIFEVCAPDHLRYYLGQFVSLERGAKLIKEDYDYIFRIRTDVIFATPDLYEDENDYIKDKRLFYHRLHKKEQGVFCKFGDLQIWEGARNISGSNDKEEDHQPKKRTTYEELSFINNQIYAKKRRQGGADVYNSKTQYLHMKDWYILGSGEELLWSMKQYITTIIIMIEKSRVFLKKDGIDINWSAGEIVCGEVLGLNGINAGELAHNYIDHMIIPNRLLKIANKYTKQDILDNLKVRVLADSDMSLKDQYKKILYDSE